MPVLRERRDGAYYFRVRVQDNLIATFQVSREGTRELVSRNIRPGDVIPQQTYREGIQKRWFYTGGAGAGWIQDAPIQGSVPVGTVTFPRSESVIRAEEQDPVVESGGSAIATSETTIPPVGSVPEGSLSNGIPILPLPNGAGAEARIGEPVEGIRHGSELGEVEYPSGDEPGWKALLDSLNGLIGELAEVRDRSALMRFASFDELDDIFWQLYRFSEDTRTEVAHLESRVGKWIDGQ